MHGLLLLACTAGSIQVGTEDTGVVVDTATDTGEPLPSTFESGRFQTTGLAILDRGQGLDLDGDGEIDNQAPDLLALLDPFTADDMSREGVNETLVQMLEAEELILLMDANYAQAHLTVDLLLARRDRETGELIADPSNYDDAGNPTSHFGGEFTDQTAFATDAATANLPFPVVRGEPPVLIPLAEALLSGAMEELVASGVLAGGLPVQGLIDQVVDPLIPQEGPNGDYDPANFLNMSREEFLAWTLQLLEENVADLWLQDGSRAISVGLSWQVVATQEWPEAE
jgi:hypothetical protein